MAAASMSVCEEPMDVEVTFPDEGTQAAVDEPSDEAGGDPGKRTIPVASLSGVSVQRSFKEPLPDTSRKYENKSGTFITGVDVTSKEAVERKEHRAKRFDFRGGDADGTPATHTDIVIDKHALCNAVEGVRLEALCVCGVDDMSTDEIFSLFRKYAPASIEWINDSSCNVVWLDDNSASRALLSLSQMAAMPETRKPSTEKPPRDDEYLSLMSDGETEEEAGGVGGEGGPAPTDKQEVSNRGVFELRSVLRNELRLVTAPHSRPSSLYMRFATNGDRKEVGAARKSRYYMKYGNPNYGGMKGIISSSWKRRYHSRRLQRDVFKKKEFDAEEECEEGGAFTRSHGGDLCEVTDDTIPEEDEDESTPTHSPRRLSLTATTTSTTTTATTTSSAQQPHRASRAPARTTAKPPSQPTRRKMNSCSDDDIDDRYDRGYDHDRYGDRYRDDALVVRRKAACNDDDDDNDDDDMDYDLELRMISQQPLSVEVRGGGRGGAALRLSRMTMYADEVEARLKTIRRGGGNARGDVGGGGGGGGGGSVTLRPTNLQTSPRGVKSRLGSRVSDGGAVGSAVGGMAVNRRVRDSTPERPRRRSSSSSASSASSESPESTKVVTRGQPQATSVASTGIKQRLGKRVHSPERSSLYSHGGGGAGGGGGGGAGVGGGGGGGAPQRSKVAGQGRDSSDVRSRLGPRIDDKSALWGRIGPRTTSSTTNTTSSSTLSPTFRDRASGKRRRPAESPRRDEVVEEEVVEEEAEDDSKLQNAWGAMLCDRERRRGGRGGGGGGVGHLANLPSLQIEIKRDSSSGSESE